jgi:ribosomal protein S18 acetylase RimI-like enzyme
VKDVSLQVVSLSDESEKRFLDFAALNRLDYFFFVFDWTYKRSVSQIFLAEDNHASIAGAMLIYMDHMVQVRGTREAIRALLNSLNKAQIEISAPVNCRDIIQAKYPEHKVMENIVLLSLRKGEEHLALPEEPEVLGVKDADELAALMRRVYPDFWGDMSAEYLKQMYNETVWLGKQEEGRLVAFGVAAFAELGSHILFIGTDAEHRRRGYAANIVSVLVKRILARFELATIFVVEDNLPALNIYKKVGFKPCRCYVHVKT